MGGSSPHEGRVEVYHNGQWGTVCHDQWDIIDATVVCRQLDYALATSAPGQAAFGPGSGPIWYDDVDCSGTEMNLTQCLHTALGTHNCSHDEDAGVVCASKPGFCDITIIAPYGVCWDNSDPCHIPVLSKMHY